MDEGAETQRGAPPDGTGSRETIGELEAAVQRNVEPLLDKLKQAAKHAALGAIEEMVRKYGGSFAGEVRQTLRAAVDDLVTTQVERLVAELAPGGDAAGELIDGLRRELREFANTTLRDLFEKRLPEYSRWAGRSVIDYALAGILFVIAAVLLAAGGVLALQRVGVPPHATFLSVGAAALGSGYVVLKARARRGRDAPPNG